MKPGIWWFLGVLLMSIITSCQVEGEPKTCAVYVKKSMMEPFSGFQVADNEVLLNGNRDAVLPLGGVKVTLSGTGAYGYYVVSYFREIGDQKFNPAFGYRDLDHIEVMTPDDNNLLFNREEDSLKIMYEKILQDVKQKKARCGVFFYLPASCFGKIQHPEVRVGSIEYFRQFIGSTRKLINKPYIKMNALLFRDMKKKGLLKATDRLYVNCGGNGYKYQKVGKVDEKELFE